MSAGSHPERDGQGHEAAREALRYPVPWDLVFGLTGHIRRGSRTDVDAFTRDVVARMDPAPVYEGLEHLPPNPGFLLIANHYQRKGLWILHTASAITQGIRRHYGEGDPPVRWVVTANWPRWKFGRWSCLHRAMRAAARRAPLHCYSIPFSGKDPGRTARALRGIRAWRAARAADWPFPEGVAGSAER